MIRKFLFSIVPVAAIAAVALSQTTSGSLSLDKVNVVNEVVAKGKGTGPGTGMGNGGGHGKHKGGGHGKQKTGGKVVKPPVVRPA